MCYRELNFFSLIVKYRSWVFRHSHTQKCRYSIASPFLNSLESLTFQKLISVSKSNKSHKANKQKTHQIETKHHLTISKGCVTWSGVPPVALKMNFMCWLFQLFSINFRIIQNWLHLFCLACSLWSVSKNCIITQFILFNNKIITF